MLTKAGLSRRRVLCLTGVTFALVPGVAHAHARLDHSAPSAGSSLRAAPKEVSIWFSEALEASFSTIEVRAADGKQVDQHDAHLDPQNKKLMRVTLAELPAGAYKVSWRTLSVDTHKSDGSFEFKVTG
jgi:methionine-rich copper-binding protein CopC